MIKLERNQAFPMVSPTFIQVRDGFSSLSTKTQHNTAARWSNDYSHTCSYPSRPSAQRLYKP